jgi:hypothetical protein
MFKKFRQKVRDLWLPAVLSKAQSMDPFNCPLNLIGRRLPIAAVPPIFRGGGAELM